MEVTKLEDVIYDDKNNGLLFLETGMVVHRKEYLDNKEAIFFGSYSKEIDGSGIIYDINTKQKLGFFKYNIPNFTTLGLLKLGNMDIHIKGKASFESTIINYLINNKIEDISISLDGGLDGLNIFFLKYISNKDVLTTLLWYINRHKQVILKLKLHGHSRLVYEKADPNDFSRCYSTIDFLKKYETMGLELSVEELSTLLAGFKDRSLARGKPTTNDFTVNYHTHPNMFKRPDMLKPFNIPTGGARCTMMDEIKNLDVETISPKTTTIGDMSTYNDRIILAYNQFLNTIFKKEKYSGISIRIPYDYTDNWFELLPCCKYHKINSVYTSNRLVDEYVSIKKLDDGVIQYSLEYGFSIQDKVLNMSIKNLETRLIDIIMDDVEYNKSSIVGQGIKVKSNNDLVHEIKDIGSDVSKNDVNDDAVSIGQLLNNMVKFGQCTIPDTKVYNLRPSNILTSVEMSELERIYNNTIGIVSISNINQLSVLNDEYKKRFKIAIDSNILYPNLKFNYKYGYGVCDNSLSFNVVKATVFPFMGMVLNTDMNIYNDIHIKYTVLRSTWLNNGIIVDGKKYLTPDILVSCNEVYGELFKSYIDIGVLKPYISFIKSNDLHILPSLEQLFMDEFMCSELIPNRSFDLFNTLKKYIHIKNRYDDILKLYRVVFKYYIDIGVVKNDIPKTDDCDFTLDDILIKGV